MRSIKPKKKKAPSTNKSIDLTQKMVALLSGPTLTLEPAAFSQTPIMPTAESKKFTKTIIDLLAGNNKDKSDEEDLMKSIKPKKKKALSTKESIELTQEMVSLLSGPTLTLEPAASSLTPIMPTAESKRFTKAIIDLLAGNNKDMSDEENLSPEHNDSKENNGIHLDIDHLIEASKPVSFLSGSSATLGLSEEELAMAIQESIKFNGEKEGYPDCSGSRSGFFYSAKEERKRER